MENINSLIGKAKNQLIESFDHCDFGSKLKEMCGGVLTTLGNILYSY